MIDNQVRRHVSFCFLNFIIAAFIFNIKFQFSNLSSLYFGIASIIFFGISGQIRSKPTSAALMVVVAPLYLAFILATGSYLSNLPDADYFLGAAIFIMASVGLCSFGFFTFFAGKDGKTLLCAVIAVLTVNAILMLMMFISPQIQAVYLNLLAENNFALLGGSDNAIESMHRFRMVGATGFATYSAGFTQTIGLFFLAAYYYVADKKLNLLFLVVAVLLAVSAVLAARSSFLGIFLWTIFCGIFFRRHFVVVFIGLVISIVFILLVLITLAGEVGGDFFSNWLLELFTSGTNSESLTETVQMLDTPFMDSGLYGFSRWYGDLGYDYFRSADVGYIRLILAGGFASLSFVVLHFVLLGLLFFRGTNIVFFRTLYCFLMVYIFVIMFKGAILFDFFAFDFLMLMLAWIANQNKDIVKIK